MHPVKKNQAIKQTNDLIGLQAFINQSINQSTDQPVEADSTSTELTLWTSLVTETEKNLPLYHLLDWAIAG